MPEPGTLAGALDQAGDVGHDELAVVRLQGAEHGLERRERVVGDLRRGARQARDERGLAGVRQPDETDIGQELQLQRQPPLLPRQPALGEARRLAGRRGEPLVAASARSAARDDRALARGHEVVAAPLQVAVLAPGLGPRRHAQQQRLAVGAVAEPPAAVTAARGAVLRPMAELLQVAQGVVAHEHDVTPTPAVAAVGPAAGHVGLAAEAAAAVPAGAGADLDSGAVVEHRRAIVTCPSIRKGPPRP